MPKSKIVVEVGDGLEGVAAGFFSFILLILFDFLKHVQVLFY